MFSLSNSLVSIMFQSRFSGRSNDFVETFSPHIDISTTCCVIIVVIYIKSKYRKCCIICSCFMIIRSSRKEKVEDLYVILFSLF